MPTTDTNVPQVVVNKLTKAQYEAATKEPTEFYAVTDEQIGTSDIADGAVTAAKASFTTYSTSEQVVGTWIDGKPLYRIVYTNGPLTSGEVSMGATPGNVVMIQGWIMSTSGYVMPYGNFSTSDSGHTSRVFSDGQYIKVQQGTSWQGSNYSAIVVVHYTKTTD